MAKKQVTRKAEILMVPRAQLVCAGEWTSIMFVEGLFTFLHVEYSGRGRSSYLWVTPHVISNNLRWLSKQKENSGS